MEAIQPDAPRLHSDDTKDGPARRAIRTELRKLERDKSPTDHSAEIAKLNAQLEATEDDVYYNISAETHSAAGDVEQGFAESDLVVEDTYVIPRVHQTYMEPHVSVVDVESTGKVTVWASTQGPFAIRSGIAGTLGIPLNQINVVATTMGGGFGGTLWRCVDARSCGSTLSENRSSGEDSDDPRRGVYRWSSGTGLCD